MVSIDSNECLSENSFKPRIAVSTAPKQCRKLLTFGGHSYGKQISYLDLDAKWHDETIELPQSRVAGAAAVLRDGRVLLTGGDNNNIEEYQRLTVSDVVELDDSMNITSNFATVLNFPFTARAYCGAAALDGGSLVVVAGGRGDKGRLRSAECYFASNRRPIQLPDMHEVRSALAMTAGMYSQPLTAWATGGHSLNDESYLSSVEYFDSENQQWISAPNLPQSVVCHAATTIGHRIFVNGGESVEKENERLTYLVRGEDRSRPVWHYVLVNKDKLEEFLIRTNGGSLDVADYGKVLHSGWGKDPPDKIRKKIPYKPLRSMNCFDIREGRWQTLAEMENGRKGHQLTATGDICLYVLGGINDDVNNIVEIYDIRINRWRSGPVVNKKMFHFQSVCIPNGQLSSNIGAIVSSIINSGSIRPIENCSFWQLFQIDVNFLTVKVKKFLTDKKEDEQAFLRTICKMKHENVGQVFALDQYEMIALLEKPLCSLRNLLYGKVRDKIMQYDVPNAIAWCLQIACGVDFLHKLQLNNLSIQIEENPQSVNVDMFAQYSNIIVAKVVGQANCEMRNAAVTFCEILTRQQNSWNNDNIHEFSALLYSHLTKSHCQPKMDDVIAYFNYLFNWCVSSIKGQLDEAVQYDTSENDRAPPKDVDKYLSLFKELNFNAFIQFEKYTQTAEFQDLQTESVPATCNIVTSNCKIVKMYAAVDEEVFFAESLRNHMLTKNNCEFIILFLGTSVAKRHLVFEAPIFSLHSLLHEEINNRYISYSIVDGLEWCKQIATAVAHLHKQGITHGHLNSKEVQLYGDKLVAKIPAFSSPSPNSTVLSNYRDRISQIKDKDPAAKQDQNALELRLKLLEITKKLLAMLIHLFIDKFAFDLAMYLMASKLWELLNQQANAKEPTTEENLAKQMKVALDSEIHSKWPKVWDLFEQQVNAIEPTPGLPVVEDDLAKRMAVAVASLKVGIHSEIWEGFIRKQQKTKDIRSVGKIFWEIVYRKQYNKELAIETENSFRILGIIYKSCLVKNDKKPKLSTMIDLISFMCKKASTRLKNLNTHEQVCSYAQPPQDREAFETIWTTWERYNLINVNIVDIEDVISKLSNLDANSLIAEGTLGKVYKIEINEKALAVKVITGTKFENGLSFNEEIKCLTKVAEQDNYHKHIVQFFGSGLLESQFYFIVLELAVCSLFNLIHEKNNTTNQYLQYSICNGLSWSRNIADAVAYLHAFNPPIVHCNLTPQNVLLFDNYIVAKITDIGFTQLAEIKKSLCGTSVRYMSPEVCDGTETSTASDVYSTGTIIFEIFSRKKFTKGTSFRPNTHNCLTKIYADCVNTDPTNRPSINEVLELLTSVIINGLQLSDIAEISNELGQESYPFLSTDPYIELWREWDQLGEVTIYSSNPTKQWKLPVNTNLYKLQLQDIAVTIFHSDRKTEWSQTVNLLDNEHPHVSKKLTAAPLSNGCFHVMTEYGLPLESALHEKVDGGYLKYSVTNIISWCKQIADGLSHLHALQVVHGSLSPSSITLSKDFLNIKIAYFGGNALHNLEHDINKYKMPLAIFEETFINKTTQADVYRAGTVFWEIVHRQRYKESEEEKLEVGQDYPALRLIYESCLDKQDKRPDISTVYKAICLISKRLVTDKTHLTNSVQVVMLCDSIPPPQGREEFSNMFPKWERNNLRRQLIKKTIIDMDDVISYLTSKEHSPTFVDKGVMGKVYRMTFDTESIAIKVIEQGNYEDKKAFQRELTSFTSMAEQENIHPNIVNFLGFGHLGDQNYFIALEFALCSLYKLLFEPEEAKPLQYSIGNGLSWAKQIADAVTYLHNFTPCIIHRDIKPQNILLFDNYNVAKITDFGLARYMEQQMTVGVGTLRYMAQEVFEGDDYNAGCDVYSTGVVFYEIFSRKKFKKKSRLDKNIHDRLKQIYIDCINTEPEKRPSMNKVLETIQVMNIEALLPQGLPDALSNIDQDNWTFQQDDPYLKVWRQWDEVGIENHWQESIAGHALLPLGRIFVFGGQSESRGPALSSVCSVATVGDDNWREELFELPRPLNSGAAAVLSNERQILLIGGAENTEASKPAFSQISSLVECDESALVSVSTTIGKSPLVDRIWCDAVAVDSNRKLVLAGGYEGKNELKSTELFVESLGCCVHLPDMNEKRSRLAMAMGATQQNNQVVVTGGHDGNSTLKTVELFDLARMRWIVGPRMNKKRDWHAAALLGNAVYVVGKQLNKSTEFLDDRQERWQPTTDMLQARCGHRMLAVDDHHLFVIGGKMWSQSLSTVEIFDERNQLWLEAKPMKIGRWDFQAVKL